MLYFHTLYLTDALKLSGIRYGIQQIKDYYLNWTDNLQMHLNKQTFLIIMIVVDFMFGWVTSQVKR